ncbi:copper homeostasis protein CutC [Paenibacillus sp. P96]|uniref:PF03932 family protein CutC n=1 Tax=Paenibacillus zeirhizosphaerae TaxID=2987519 RepID=A0ABT9FKW5_9BACL|nr:copper homeostasis protein CutC [Paenibacillus sp. P96]MDP4095334.1 copper homeostasis protein CutC [Paenibacillus sp. P96]
MSEKKRLEVIATSIDDILQLNDSGADRIELVSALSEGGLTPSIGMIERAVEVSSLPIRVMIRPHSRSFRYSKEDLEVMARDIRAAEKLGVSGVVLGVLTEDRQVDTEALSLLLGEVKDLSVTFHRAFDEARDLEEAFNTLLNFPQIDRILTSGGCSTAVEGMSMLARLRQRSEGTRIRILAGSGLDEDNISDFLAATGVEEVHVGRAVRLEQRLDGPIVSEAIRRIKQSLQ